MPDREFGKRKPFIVLTPVRDEEWIIESFLKSTLLWADHIILSDQMSNDNTRQIASKFPNVEVIENTSTVFNESENRRRLLAKAREITQDAVIFFLDADERLTASILNTDVQEQILGLPPGTAIQINFANVTPEMLYWEVEINPVAFVDDGRESDSQGEIHFPRTTFENFVKTAEFENLKLIHLQYLDIDRVRSKHRWYQMWEFLNIPNTKPVKLYRKYHHMDSIPKELLLPIPQSWLSEYEMRGIGIFDYLKMDEFWWDSEVNKWFSEHGTRKFRRIAIDDRSKFGTEVRSSLDRLIFSYLRKTQPHYRSLRYNLTFVLIYACDRIISLFWR